MATVMETAAPARLMTTEEFLALPEDDGVERMLIRGEVWERTMTRRNKFHARLESVIAKLIGNWNDSRPAPRGEVYSGEAGVRLSRNPDSTFGIDVVYLSAERLKEQSDETTLLVGPPTLAVEILSPSDRIEDVQVKIDVYLAAGVPVVWLADPHFQTVTVYRPRRGPEMLHGDAVLTDDEHLPGLEIAVANLFPA
jgi:Uma2 family endonuclease